MAIDEVKYLILDIESVPDSKLIKKVKYPSLDISEAEAVAKYQEEILTNTDGATFFIPATFQYPITICIAKAREDFSLIDLVLLDEPAFRPREMVRLFWEGVEHQYQNASLVTFNGRGFDIPLLEFMAFRYGFTAKRHFRDKFGARYRFGVKHIDVHDCLSNYNAVRMNGGLDLFAKTLGKPGKMDAKGEEVYDMFAKGKLKAINDYCIHDVLDTYFVFLRTRVMLGEMTLAREQDVVKQAHEFIKSGMEKNSAFKSYLDAWGAWDPWP